MIHGFISFVSALILGILSPWCCFLPAAFYLGREHSQAEYRYMSAHHTKRENSPWYCGWLPESWNQKAILDAVLPFLMGLLVFVLFGSV